MKGKVMGVLKSIGTATYVGARVALIVGAGLVAVGAAVAIKEKFTGCEDDVDATEIEDGQTTEES